MALRAAGACFKSWLDAPGGTDTGEDIRARDQAIAFIALHGSSRFERVDDEAPLDQKIFNRAGFKRREGNEWEYLVLPSVWRSKVCAGLDATQVALRRSIDTVCSGKNGRMTNTRRCGSHGLPRGYCIRGSVLGDDDDEDDCDG